MLTPEQIKNLKPGDIIDIRGVVNLPLRDGNILVELRYESKHMKLPAYSRVSTEFISLPPEKPKHDPCRKSKKGDEVKRRTVDGRTDPDVPEGIYLTVTTDEDKYGNVRVQEPNGRSIVTKSVFLELVTPVEELDPYFIDESTEEESFDIMKRVGKLYLTRNCIYYKTEVNEHAELTREEALSAAKAECKRLNEEYRKEQKNG